MRNALLTTLFMTGAATLTTAQTPPPPPKPAVAPKPKTLVKPEPIERLHGGLMGLAPRLSGLELDLEQLRSEAMLQLDFVAPLAFEADALRSEAQLAAALALPTRMELEGLRADALHAMELMPPPQPSFEIEHLRSELEDRAREMTEIALPTMLAPEPVRLLTQDLRLDRGTAGITLLRPTRGTQEDSLYQAARSALNRGDYMQAAGMFRDFERRYPRSRFAPASLYWQAFALYRVGATERLREALQALASQHERYPQTASDDDVAALHARIQSALAERGDPQAQQWVRTNAAQGNTCDKEEMEVRAEALNRMVQLDPSSANTLLANVLSWKDDCSVALRRRAVYILSRSGTAEAGTTLLDVAKNDPDLSVRSDAINGLGRSPSASTVAALDQILRTNDEERLQRAALSALRSADTPEAWTIIRRVIDDGSNSDRLRTSALSAFLSGSKENRNLDADGAYLRSLYPRVDDRSMKQAIIAGVARLGGGTNEQWLLALARNNEESTTYRSYALGRLRTADLPIAEVNRLYDTMTERTMRLAVINLLSAREDSAAVDKLIEIVRLGTDPRVQSSAIQALSRKAEKDPRARQLFNDLLRKP